jgi:hypothetical protein
MSETTIEESAGLIVLHNEAPADVMARVQSTHYAGFIAFSTPDSQIVAATT